MAKNRKAVFPVQAGTRGKTAFINQPEYTLNLFLNQPSSKDGDHSQKTRRWIKTLLVQMACWEMLPAALVVLLLGGLRHD